MGVTPTVTPTVSLPISLFVTRAQLDCNDSDLSDDFAPADGADGGTTRALCVAAHHPGRDRYLQGALLEANIRAWAVVGAVLVSPLAERVRAAKGLSQELAVEALSTAHAARAQWEFAATSPDQAPSRVLTAVIASLVRRGYAPALWNGPHASLVQRCAHSLL